MAVTLRLSSAQEVKTISHPLFQIHRFTKKSIVCALTVLWPIRGVTDCFNIDVNGMNQEEILIQS